MKNAEVDPDQLGRDVGRLVNDLAEAYVWGFKVTLVLVVLGLPSMLYLEHRREERLDAERKELWLKSDANAEVHRQRADIILSHGWFEPWMLAKMPKYPYPELVDPSEPW